MRQRSQVQAMLRRGAPRGSCREPSSRCPARSVEPWSIERSERAARGGGSAPAIDARRPDPSSERRKRRRCRASAAGGELRFWVRRGMSSGIDEASYLAAEAGHGLAREYLALLRRIGPQAARVTDKAPFIIFASASSTCCCRRRASSIAAAIRSTLASRCISRISARGWISPGPRPTSPLH